MGVANRLLRGAAVLALAAVAVGAPAGADQCINDDLIVDGSACIGLDCVCNAEVFGFDTLRLKENNLRITFIDTSSAASFPRGDWQIRANESTNGGANEFAVDWLGTSATNGSGVVSTPFAIEGDAPNNALYVDDGGRVGFGTSVPSVELHVIDGDTPTLRLQQDGSAGFDPQTWDVAGNETNFFVRDVTGGSSLPLRIRPGAPSNAIFVDVDGDVGLGTSSPGGDLHVTGGDDTLALIASTGANGNAELEVRATNGTGEPVLRLSAGAGEPVRWFMSADDGADLWSNTASANGNFILNNTTNAGNEFLLTNAGSLTITGSINTTDCSPCVSDYVFEEGYELMALDELEQFIWRERHLPNVPSQADVDRAGRLNMTEMQMRLLEKIEELVLYTLEQQKIIDAYGARLAALEGRPE